MVKTTKKEILRRVKDNPMEYWNMLNEKDKEVIFESIQMALGEEWDDYSELKMDELIEKTDTYCMIADVILKIKNKKVN
jgi:TRAP-type C4-dicarboxylate transport system substrate-binding protein